ncbi:hypothetical protein HDV05_007981 [Chytridiales sp. JEL 0842]|nr:hypothetical protein HDV05_007981 [Chytridiales sp. JEL 0842]
MVQQQHFSNHQAAQLHNLNQFQNMTLDPNSGLLGFGSPLLVKQESLDLDPTDPFAITSDFGDLSGVLGSEFIANSLSATAAAKLGLHTLGLAPNSLSRINNGFINPLDPNNNKINTPGSAVISPLSNSPLDMDDFPQSAGSSSYPETPLDSRSFQPPTPVASFPLRHPPNFGNSPKSSSNNNNLSISMSALKSFQPNVGGPMTPSAEPTQLYSTSMPAALSGQQSSSSGRKAAGSTSSSLGAEGPLSSSSSSAPTTTTGKTRKLRSSIPVSEEEQQRQAEILDEKRRRRRESHNAVERRRRDNINEKIHELSSLLPDFAADGQNKGSILRRSVEYIKMMQALATRQQERMRELEDVIRNLLHSTGIQESDLGLTVPLGTVFELPQMPPLSASERMGGGGGGRRETTETSDFGMDEDY